MKFTKEQLWERFKKYYFEFPTIGLAIDVSRMNFSEDYFDRMNAPMAKAFQAMAEIERGAIANPDEKRMVGHYWLRNPQLAPTPAITKEIEDTLAAVKSFTREVHDGKIQGERGAFKNVLVIGIGGSALGPQFVSNALGHPLTDKMDVFFFDNTDPDGMDKVISKIINELGQTLCVVISKSGGTKETRNGMLEAEAAFTKAGLNFGKHTVAITGKDSELDKVAVKNNWIRRFPMWDWVGGRTSELSAVGLLPAALQGIDIDLMLKGAKECDEATRRNNVTENPSSLISLAWMQGCNAKGEKDMVVLPYKDRLELFSKYLQQLIMESLGKERDLDGKVVNQGLAVYGNKGATDQHAYVQQLREGVHNFFVTFIEVLQDRGAKSLPVEPRVTAGDYLSGFFLGTREALFDNGRESITITIPKVSPYSVGVLIALFERTVGLYASLINVNAYHQPGVEAGKKAASAVIQLQLKVLDYLQEKKGHALTSAQIASGIGAHDAFETVFKISEHLSANPDSGVKKAAGKTPFESTYQLA
ncbi:MAG: Glucose-6-phosphate isomerase [Verrucomicrobiales bacterium]|nr:Glucose-6-phosphate isomerase [Verrucomicrobiales bacterium]